MSAETSSGASSDNSQVDGESITFAMYWPQSTTPLEAVERALYALADQVSGTTSVEAGEWCLRVHPRSTTADVDRLSHRIRQEVTDQTLRVRIAERTDPVRNLVFALAFSRTGRQGENGSHGQEAADA